MKKFNALLAGVVFMATFGAGGAEAQEEKSWGLSFDNGFVNKYVWRGFLLNNTASYQPGVTFSYGNVSVSSWSNISHTGPNASATAGGHWTEHDLTVDYGMSLGDKASVSFGWINYAFPDLDEGRYSNEFYGTISFDTFLQPSFGVYGDPHQGEGMYYNFGIGHSVALPEGVALNLSASAGLNQHQWIDTTTIADVVLGVSVDLPLGSNVTLSPFYNYITGNDGLRRSGTMFTGSLAGVNLNVSY